MLTCYLLRDDVGSLCGIVALVDDITDFLVAHDEVNAIGGQGQKGVVRMLQLKDETRKPFEILKILFSSLFFVPQYNKFSLCKVI